MVKEELLVVCGGCGVFWLWVLNDWFCFLGWGWVFVLVSLAERTEASSSRPLGYGLLTSYNLIES